MRRITLFLAILLSAASACAQLPAPTLVGVERSPAGSGSIYRTLNYATSGICPRAIARDLVIDGSGLGPIVDSGSYHGPQKDAKAFPPVLDGFDVSSNAPDLEHLEIRNIPGTALRISCKGYVGGYEHASPITDQTEGHLAWVLVDRCWTGIVIESRPDTIADNLIVSDVRDDAIRDECGGNDVKFAHVYGYDRGVIFGGGPKAGPSRAGTLECENGRVGFSNLGTANGSHVAQLVCYSNLECGADLPATCTISKADITVDRPGATGIRLGGICPFIGFGKFVIPAPDGQGLHLIGGTQKARVTASFDGGADKAARTAIVVDGVIYNNRVTADSYGQHIALDLMAAAYLDKDKKLVTSYGNVFDLHDETIDQDVAWPATGRDAFLKCNTVIVNGELQK